jgi:hypothetical protein
VLVYGNVKRLSYRAPRSLQSQRSLGLRAQVSQASDNSGVLRNPEVGLGDCVQRLRMRAPRGWIRGRPCAFAGRVPTQGVATNTGQLLEGSQFPTFAGGSSSRCREQTVGRALLVSQLLRGVMRRSASRYRQTLRRTTEGRGFLPALRKDGVSAPKNR